MKNTKLLSKDILAYLVFGRNRNVKKLLSLVSGVEWNKEEKEVYELCRKFIKLPSPEFLLEEFILDQHSDREYIKSLSKIDGVFYTEDLFKINADDLIQRQEELRVKKALKDIESKSSNDILREVKSIKGVRNQKPFKLSEIRSERLRDRELESVAPSTGYKSLDGILKGFVPGRTITMTGDTNVGKTTMAANFAYNVAKQGKRVLYFSLEPGITIIEYLASIWSKKPFSELNNDDLLPPDGIDIDIYTKEQVDEIEDLTDIVENSERYDLIVVDHFGYFTTNGANKTQVESNAMKKMASLSKANKTCILLIVHPRKSAPGKKKKELNIQDISGSAAFSQDATDVLIIARNKDEDDTLDIKYATEGYIAVHKTKSGPNGAVAVNFIDGTARIVEGYDWGTEEAGFF